MHIETIRSVGSGEVPVQHKLRVNIEYASMARYEQFGRAAADNGAFRNSLAIIFVQHAIRCGYDRIIRSDGTFFDRRLVTYPIIFSEYDTRYTVSNFARFGIDSVMKVGIEKLGVISNVSMFSNNYLVIYVYQIIFRKENERIQFEIPFFEYGLLASSQYQYSLAEFDCPSIVYSGFCIAAIHVLADSYHTSRYFSYDFDVAAQIA